MSDLIKEIFIEKYPFHVTINGTKKITNQMENCICKIYKSIKEKGTGFFCKIPLPDKTSINVLITNYHILNEEYLNSNKLIKYSMNNEENFYEILLDDSRKIYTNKELDVTFIEITKKDNIKHFLEIDEQIKHEKNFYPELFDEKPIYILHYQEGENILVSYGIIKGIDNNEIKHTCSTEKGSSGSPILSLKNFKVIGIHIGCKKKSNNKNYSFNHGTFMKYAFVEFLNFLQEKKIKETNSETNSNINEIDNSDLNNSNNQNFTKNSYKDDKHMKTESTNDDNINIINDQNKDNSSPNKINEIYKKINLKKFKTNKIIETKYTPNKLRNTIDNKSKYLLENYNEEQNTNSSKKKNDCSEIKERKFEKYFQDITRKSIGDFSSKKKKFYASKYLYTYIKKENKSFKKFENINNRSKETIKKNKINNIKSYNQEQYNQLPEDH